jgi:stearoyl-CoA desaturase (delta-9 desaturase)
MLPFFSQPGGANILRKYSVRLQDEIGTWRKADWAFNGGLNNHSRAAKRRMYELRVAKLVD